MRIGAHSPCNILIVGFAGTVLEILSFFLFEGLWYQTWPICGSACEIWPGIPTSGVCILVCVARNGWYLPAFIGGIALLGISVLMLIRKFRGRKA